MLSSLFSSSTPTLTPVPEQKCSAPAASQPDIPAQEESVMPELSPVQQLIRLEEVITDVLVAAFSHERPLSKELRDCLAQLEEASAQFYGDPEDDEDLVPEAESPKRPGTPIVPHIRREPPIVVVPDIPVMARAHFNQNIALPSLPAVQRVLPPTSVLKSKRV